MEEKKSREAGSLITELQLPKATCTNSTALSPYNQLMCTANREHQSIMNSEKFTS
jgi:hypothetical protein